MLRLLRDQLARSEFHRTLQRLGWQIQAIRESTFDEDAKDAATSLVNRKGEEHTRTFLDS